jgi:hypothetical protein
MSAIPESAAASLETSPRRNPLLGLPFENAIEALGPEYWDVVEAAYGRFEGRTPLRALRYHRDQFCSYNPQLGVGRSFLYGQLRDRHGQLQDLGTKGSGTPPHRRLGFDDALVPAAALVDFPDPVPPTLRLLAGWPVVYGRFFAALAERVQVGGLPATADELEPFVAEAPAPPRAEWLACLQRWNLAEPPIRPLIERIWTAIDERDDCTPLQNRLAQTVSPAATEAGCSVRVRRRGRRRVSGATAHQDGVFYNTSKPRLFSIAAMP